MLTLFPTSKRFRNLFAIIQRNALQDWKFLHSDSN